MFTTNRHNIFLLKDGNWAVGKKALILVGLCASCQVEYLEGKRVYPFAWSGFWVVGRVRGEGKEDEG